MRSFFYCFGMVTWIVGGALFLGNVTGIFPTFPYAGFLLMIVGVTIQRAGISSRRRVSAKATEALLMMDRRYQGVRDMILDDLNQGAALDQALDRAASVLHAQGIPWAEAKTYLPLLVRSRLERSRRTVGPGVALVVLGVVNLLAAGLVTPALLTATETTLPPKSQAAAPSEPRVRRLLTPDERRQNRAFALAAAAIVIPGGLLLLIGGVQMARRRWYPMTVASSVAAMIPVVSVFCLAGLPVGIWALVVLLDADVRATFS
jgi:hypothetical protein